MAVLETEMDKSKAEAAVKPLAQPKARAPQSDTLSDVADVADKIADVAEDITDGVVAKPATIARNKHRKDSGGEMIFDRTVYTGIGFGVNEVSSMIIADELRYGHNKYFGKEIFEKAAHGWAKILKLKDKVGKDGKTITKLARAENTLEVGALLIGGTLLIIPMKWLEDRKEKIVKATNHVIDKFRGRDSNDDAMKARDQEVAEAIACQPKQSWTSLIIGRIFAVVTNMFILSNTLFAEPRATAVKDFSEKHVTNLTVKADKMLGDKPNSAIKRMIGDTKKPFEERRFPRYARILGIETLYTLSSSIVLEIASKITAKKKTLVHNPELCDEIEKRAAQAPMAKPVEAPATEEISERKFTQSVTPRAERSQERFASHVQKLAAEPERQPQTSL